jgi:hypothetical protein
MSATDRNTLLRTTDILKVYRKLYVTLQTSSILSMPRPNIN